MDQILFTDRQVAASLNVAKSTIWRWVAEGRFPQPVRLAGKCTRWKRADIEQFVNEAAAAVAA